MKFTFAAAGAAAFALTAGVAAAEAHGDHGEKEQCFDKGTLTYFDCPVDEPEVVEEEVMMDDGLGFYIGARGGAAWVESEFSLSGATEVEQDYDVGYIISGMIGVELDDVAPGITLRPELELGYLSAEVDEHTATGLGSLAGSVGDTDVFFGFVNLFADIELIESADLIIGGGIGFGNVDFDGHGATVPGLAMDDSDTGFGYNVGAGLGIEVAPNIEIEALYRYMSFDVEVTSTTPFEDDADVDAHTGTVGIRFKF